MTDLLALYSTLHRAHEHGIAIVPGDLETVSYIANPDARRVTIARHLGLIDWAVAVTAAIGELLPDVSAQAVAAGASVHALAVGAESVGVVVPMRPRPRLRVVSPRT